MHRRKALALTALAVTLSAGTVAVAHAASDSNEVAAAVLGGIDFDRPEVVATGLEVPWGLAFLPDGSALVAERNDGGIVRVTRGGAPQQVATVTGVRAGGESGLLGLAVAPTFAQDNLVYACFTSASDIRIVRFRLDAPDDQQVIFSGAARANIHDGGRIKFGPDGMLYATIGDAAVTATAQNRTSPNGKILRMRPDGTVPPDNPFAGSLVYSMGHRNPQGLAWDSAGRLWSAELGQSTFDELNLIEAGGNYGWPTCEGMCNDARFTNPKATWSTAEASPSGVAIVGDTAFMGALRGQRLWRIELAGTETGEITSHFVGTYGRMRAVTAVPGESAVWISTSNGNGTDRILRSEITG